MTKCLTLQGNVRRDPWGRFVVDTCSSDDQHLRDSVVKPGDDRARCRRLTEEAFEHLEGKSGTIKIEITFCEDLGDEEVGR